MDIRSKCGWDRNNIEFKVTCIGIVIMFDGVRIPLNALFLIPMCCSCSLRKVDDICVRVLIADHMEILQVLHMEILQVLHMEILQVLYLLYFIFCAHLYLTIFLFRDFKFFFHQFRIQFNYWFRNYAVRFIVSRYLGNLRFPDTRRSIDWIEDAFWSCESCYWWHRPAVQKFLWPCHKHGIIVVHLFFNARFETH